MAIDIKVGETVVYNISDLELQLLKSYINEDTLVGNINDWVMCLVRDKCNAYAAQFKEEWIYRLQQDPAVTSVPLANQDFVDMVIARPDYKTKKQQDELLS
jgi:hypothetical protein